MNSRRLALFGGSAVVVAGGLIYSFGIFPPTSGRDGQGAIGERKVYRAEQASDAAVNPDAAPVAVSANAQAMKGNALSGLQDGQLFQLTSGQMYQLRNGSLVALKSGDQFRVIGGQMLQLQNGALRQMNGQMAQLQNGFVLRLQNGMVMQLQNGMVYRMNNGELMHQLSDGQFHPLN